KLLPLLSDDVIHRRIQGGADGKDPLTVGIERNRRKVSLRFDRRQGPVLTSVRSSRHRGHILIRFLVVAAGDDAVLVVSKCYGEDARRGRTVNDGGLGNSPGFAGILRQKNARRAAAGNEPNVLLALHGDAGAAGGKCPFA